MKVRVGAGTGVEWLMAAMAVADPDWRAVLTHGETRTTRRWPPAVARSSATPVGSAAQAGSGCSAR